MTPVMWYKSVYLALSTSVAARDPDANCFRTVELDGRNLPRLQRSVFREIRRRRCRTRSIAAPLKCCCPWNKVLGRLACYLLSRLSREMSIATLTLSRTKKNDSMRDRTKVKWKQIESRMKVELKKIWRNGRKRRKENPILSNRDCILYRIWVSMKRSTRFDHR